MNPLTRTGTIFDLDGCPPLDDPREGEAKRRPVVVVSPKVDIERGEVVIVAVSTKLGDAPEHIRLPDRGVQPRTTSLLKEPSWVTGRWCMAVDPARLVNRRGYISGDILRRVIAEVGPHVGSPLFLELTAKLAASAPPAV